MSSNKYKAWPGSVEPYHFNFSQYLGQGETIESVTTVATGSITLGTPSVDGTGKVLSVLATFGSASAEGQISCTIVTSLGYTSVAVMYFDIIGV